MSDSANGRATTDNAETSVSGRTLATYAVTGMTCEHCVNAVSSEVAAIAGVTDVAVDLTNGSVTVTSEAPLTRAQVKAAVEEAGYELVSSP